MYLTCNCDGVKEIWMLRLNPMTGRSLRLCADHAEEHDHGFTFEVYPVYTNNK